MWNDVAFKGTDGEWELLGDNGWFAMMAWAAGPDNVRKTEQSDSGRTVRVTHISKGVETTFLVPFTPADRCYIEDDVNDYLQEAGIPARPSGFDWYLRVPSGWLERQSQRQTQSQPDASVIQTLGTLMLEAQQDQQSPAQLRPHVERIVSNFYAAATD